MSSTQARSATATETSREGAVDMRLEVVVIPVADVDRAKSFYGNLGWRLDADFAGDDWRVIQFTPPGSGCSVIFGRNVTAAAPGSAQGLYLIVSDIEDARSELLRRGVRISEVFHGAGDAHAGADEPYLSGRLRVGGPDPERRSYGSYASFSDPDGNGWLLQEVTARLPGRVEAGATHSPRRPSSRLHSAERRPHTASTRSGPAGTMRTGRTGMPSTSSGSGAAIIKTKSQQHETGRTGRHISRSLSCDGRPFGWSHAALPAAAPCRGQGWPGGCAQFRVDPIVWPPEAGRGRSPECRVR